MLKSFYLKVLYGLFFYAFFSPCAFAQPCKEVVGYFASWKWYKRNKLVNPSTIDYSKYTIINYAFFKPLADGSIIDGDPNADIALLTGTSSLVENAHQNKVRVVASIGGWTWSNVFPGIAANELKRKKFARECVELIKKYNLDGIDIDWEFPGKKAHQGSPADKQNFSLLLAETRKSLDLCEGFINRKLLLTIAVGPARNHMDYIDWPTVIPLVDIIHVMTYNYHGPWEKITGHNAPLYPITEKDVFNVSYSIATLIESYHVPASKITLGLAFYGRSVVQEVKPALHTASTGVPDAGTFYDDKGTPSYYNIVAQSYMFDQKHDNLAAVPYMTGKHGVYTFLSYDNPQSITAKALYAVEKNLKGVVIWDISGDYIETEKGSGKISGTPLCDAILDAFCNGKNEKNTEEEICNFMLMASPNPFREELDITWNNNCKVSAIIISNQQGQQLYSSKAMENGFLIINTSGWTKGLYHVQLLSGTSQVSQKVLKL